MARKGRPSKYNPELHKLWIVGLTRRGCTLDEVASDLNIALSTLNNWLSENPDLMDAVKKARTLPDVMVEESLFKRAMGYKVTKTRTLVSTEADGSQRPAKAEILEEEIPADVTACIFWLKNRQPEVWRDINKKIDVKTGKDSITIVTSSENCADELKELLEK